MGRRSGDLSSEKRAAKIRTALTFSENDLDSTPTQNFLKLGQGSALRVDFIFSWLHQRPPNARQRGMYMQCVATMDPLFRSNVGPPTRRRVFCVGRYVDFRCLHVSGFADDIGPSDWCV